jgi:hypothetical protein
MKGKKITEYTFEVKAKLKIVLTGIESDENYHFAFQKVFKDIYKDFLIKEDNIECIDVKEHECFEKEDVAA